MGYMDVRTFTVYGRVRGKMRHRSRNAGKFAIQYDPKENKMLAAHIRAAYLLECRGAVPFGEVPLVLDVTAYFGIPKSTSKKNRALMLAGQILPTKKPDFDNIAKSIADALSKGVAYPDDKFIVRHRMAKDYAESPHLLISLYEYKPKEE